MKKYKVGRNLELADIVISSKERSVSAVHMEIQQVDYDKVYVNDLKSTNGIYHVVDGVKTRMSHGYVKLNEILILGEYKTTARFLLGNKLVESHESADKAPVVDYVRDESGAIIRKFL